MRRAANPAVAIALVASLAALSIPAAGAASAASQYAQLATDRVVDGGPVVLVSRTIGLARPAWVYVQSDGGYSPRGKAQANAWISVDGSVASNDSIIDWRRSDKRQRHAWNAIGARRLATGRHVVALHGRSIGAPVVFHAGGNLSVLVDAADTVRVRSTTAPSPLLDFDTRGTLPGAALSDAGRRVLLDVPAGNTRGPVVALASGSSYVQAGSAMRCGASSSMASSPGSMP